MFFIEGGNVLTKKNLQQIQDVEKRFLNDENFKGKVCRLTTDGDCVKPQSLLRFFDGTFAEVSPVFNDPDFNNISGVVYEANRWELKRTCFAIRIINEWRISLWLLMKSHLSSIWIPLGLREVRFKPRDVRLNWTLESLKKSHFNF